MVGRRLFINGKWVDPVEGGTIECVCKLSYSLICYAETEFFSGVVLSIPVSF